VSCAVDASVDSVEKLPITALRPADSPRTAGTDAKHIRMLADLETVLPPIVVHRSTMRVIDGMHRLRAAQLRGDAMVAVRLVDGTAAEAFVLAVELNHAHGLPLSLADRTAAAARIVGSHPDWSDRRIAAATGLAANTVGAIRRRSTAPDARPPARIGRDGRTRPGSVAEARRLAGELIADNPGASLREVARAVGVSPATVSDVRARLQRGESPITPRQQEAARRTPVLTSLDRTPTSARADVVRRLRSDPSLRFTDGGRVLLRLLDVCTLEAGQWDRITATVPPYHRAAVVELAQRCANTWQEFADRLIHHTDALPARSS
jgi:ParB-like chromosome segregation protein Spo0J